MPTEDMIYSLPVVLYWFYLDQPEKREHYSLYLLREIQAIHNKSYLSIGDSWENTLEDGTRIKYLIELTPYI